MAEFLKLPAHKFIKTLVYKTDANELVAVLVRGDHEVNETKLRAALGCSEVALADDAAVRAATQTAPGFLGPIGMKLRVVADRAIQGIQGAASGANEADAHYIQVDQKRDFTPSAFADLRLARGGNPCPRCESGTLETHRGIEVGQVFYLGKKYSEAMGATYLDAEGREQSIEMGCYGIGISRLVAAAIEQNHDANGIIWPFSIAPFHVLLLPINYKDKTLQEVCDRLDQELQNGGVEVLLDDRDERPESSSRMPTSSASRCALQWARKDSKEGAWSCAGGATARAKIYPSARRHSGFGNSSPKRREHEVWPPTLSWCARGGRCASG